MARLRPRPGILEIEPYVGGKAEVAGVARAVKLSANESPLGPSPHAIAALQAIASEAAPLSRWRRRPTAPDHRRPLQP